MAGQGSSWSQIRGRVGPGFGNTADTQFYNLVSKKKKKRAKIHFPVAYYALISLGEVFSGGGGRGERNGSGDKINIPFLPLATPAVREIVLFWGGGGEWKLLVCFFHPSFSLFFHLWVLKSDVLFHSKTAFFY